MSNERNRRLNALAQLNFLSQATNETISSIDGLDFDEDFAAEMVDTLLVSDDAVTTIAMDIIKKMADVAHESDTKDSFGDITDVVDDEVG